MTSWGHYVEVTLMIIFSQQAMFEIQTETWIKSTQLNLNKIYLFFLYCLIVQGLYLIKFSLFSVKLGLCHVQIVLGHVQLRLLNSQVGLKENVRQELVIINRIRDERSAMAAEFPAHVVIKLKDLWLRCWYFLPSTWQKPIKWIAHADRERWYCIATYLQW